MGVIKKVENLFEIKCSVSEETLYIPSGDDEDDNGSANDDEPGNRENNLNQFESHLKTSINGMRIKRHLPSTIGPSLLNLKNHSGKKKLRRYNIATQLLTLMEEDELQEVTIDDFIDNTKSAFSLLLENEECSKKWNEFICSSEERQKEVLEKKPVKKDWGHRPVINRALRSLLRKKNLPLGILDHLEKELITFFAAQPTKIYISPALTSFERLLLHSISTYYRLASLSFVSGPEKVKLVRVKNPRKEFPLPSLPLIQYLKSNYDLR